MYPELFWWTWSQEPWTQWEPALSVNSSDQITSFSDKPEQETTGQRDITLREPNSLTLSWMSSERRLRDAIAYKDSKSLTLSEEALDQEWEHFLSARSEKSTLIESWKPSQLCLPPRCLTLSLSPTMPLFQSINWSKTQMNAWSSITRHFTIFASEPLNWPPPLTVIWTIWSPLQWVVLPAVWGSQVNWTLTWENWQWTWFPSPDCISLWLALPHWPPEDLNNTEHWLCRNWRNRCSTQRTWCAQPIQDMEDI